MILICTIGLPISIAFSQGQPKVELITIGSEAGSMAITKVPIYFLLKVKSKKPSIDEWREMIGTFLSSEYAPSNLPMLGRYKISGDSLIFTPRFPFMAGEKYTTKLNIAYINMYCDYQLNDTHKDLLLYDTEIPQAERPKSLVTKVYPSSSELPENLLRFYIYFSNPMQKGVLESITLLNAQGEEVQGVFLNIGEELWSADNRRLTIWLDPGRIKRELGPNESHGAPLIEGQDYVLRVSRLSKDVYNQKLDTPFEKKFKVTSNDRIKPGIEDWNIETPQCSTINPIVIHFGEPMDHSLATRYLEILLDDKPFEGEFALTDNEMTMKFIPNVPWVKGRYQIRVDGRIEDIAGNNMMRLFDTDLSEGEIAEKERRYYFKSFFVR